MSVVPELHFEAAWMDPWGAMTGSAPRLRVGDGVEIKLLPGHHTYTVPLLDPSGDALWRLQRGQDALWVEVGTVLVDGGGRALDPGACTAAYELDVLRLEVVLPEASLRAVRRLALGQVVSGRSHLRNSLRAACRLRRLSAQLSGDAVGHQDCPAEQLALTPDALALAAAAHQAVTLRLGQINGARRSRVVEDLARVGRIEADVIHVQQAVALALTAAWLAGEVDLRRVARKIAAVVQHRERERFVAWAESGPKDSTVGEAMLAIEQASLQTFQQSFWGLGRAPGRTY